MVSRKPLKVILTHRGKFWTGRMRGSRLAWTANRDEAAVFSKKNKFPDDRVQVPIGAQLVDVKTGEWQWERLA